MRARKGRNVRIGKTSIIHPNVYIGDGTTIGEFCEIGIPTENKNHQVFIGPGSTIRSYTAIYNGVSIGDEFQCGHHCTIRSQTVIGNWCQLGSYSIMEGNCNFGNGVKTQSGCQISPRVYVHEFAQLFPNVQFTNDPLPPSHIILPTHVERYACVAANVLILPGMDIGQWSFVGANSFVRSPVEPFRLVVGSPARAIGFIDTLKNREHGIHHFPWPVRRLETFDPFIREEIEDDCAAAVEELKRIREGIDN